MASKGSSKHKLVGKLQLHKDEAGFYSCKRQYISELREQYLVSNVGVAKLLWPIIICIFIGIIFNNEIVWAICVILLFITTIVVATRVHNKYKSSEEEYIRREFDMTYGHGKYDETIKKLHQKKVLK